MRDQDRWKSRPRWLRLSVRGLMVLTLIIGGGLGWLGRGARIQRNAVAAIQKAGGTVAYDWEWKSGVYRVGAKPFAPNGSWIASASIISVTRCFCTSET